MIRLVLLSLYIIAFTANGKVFLKERFEYYDIAPAEVDQIKLELRKNSPVSRDNQQFHGGTEWTLIPNFRWKQDRHLCRIADVVVELKGVYTMPKLVSEKTASAPTKVTFAAYYDALLVHEKGHQDLWMQAGKKIESMLNSMEPHYSCHQLANTAKTRIATLIEEYQQLNRQYDLRTGHGRTQGASIR